MTTSLNDVIMHICIRYTLFFPPILLQNILHIYMYNVDED